MAKACLKRPSLARFFVQTVSRQKQAAKRRHEWEEKGVHVPSRDELIAMAHIGAQTGQT